MTFPVKYGENNNPLWLIEKVNGKWKAVQDCTSDGTADPGELLRCARDFGEKGFDLLRRFDAKTRALSLVPRNRLIHFLLRDRSENYGKVH
jgi:hypothetical protein